MSNDISWPRGLLGPVGELAGHAYKPARRPFSGFGGWFSGVGWLNVCILLEWVLAED